MKNQFIGMHLDFVGFSASILCAIHCAALPLLLTLAPLAGLQFLDNHWIEYSIILLSLIIALSSLVGSYKKHHKNTLALIIAIGGFTLIGLGQFLEFELTEVLLTSLGGVTIAVAHVVNWNLMRRSQLKSV